MMKLDENEKLDLIEVNENIWNKIKKWFQKFRGGNNQKEQISSIQNNNIENEEEVKDDVTTSDDDIFLKSKNAFENYNLNTESEIAEDIYNFIRERIIANKHEIEELTLINKEEMSYYKILEIMDDEEIDLENYKKTNIMKKIDDNFLFAQYQVPVGVIGIFANNLEVAIKNIFKAITTRNSIILIEENYDKYSIENLVLLIVKESLKKFGVDDNIIQIVNKKDTDEDVLKQFDLVITNEGKIVKKEYKNKVYIYIEDNYFEDIAKKEVEKLFGKEVELLTGNFEKAIEKINQNVNFGANIYTKNRKQGYRFVNLVKSKNVFFNATVLNAMETENIKDVYFTLKNIMYEYK